MDSLFHILAERVQTKYCVCLLLSVLISSQTAASPAYLEWTGQKMAPTVVDGQQLE